MSSALENISSVYTKKLCSESMELVMWVTQGKVKLNRKAWFTLST